MSLHGSCVCVCVWCDEWAGGCTHSSIFTCIYLTACVRKVVWCTQLIYLHTYLHIYTAYLLVHILCSLHIKCTYFILKSDNKCIFFLIFCTEKGGDPVDGIYVCLYIRTCVVFVYTYVCMFEYIRTCVCLCVCVCVCVCMNVCMCVYECMYVCMYECMYVCV